MKLQQLKFLTAIEDSNLSITAAAERLHTSQPGVSRQIKLLEEELGVELFVRKGRSLVGVTAAGTEVIKHARRVLGEIDTINAITEQHRTEEKRVLSIATTHTQARYVLPSIIAELKDRYPDVKLNLHQGTSEQIAELISRDEIDFAMASGSRNQFQDLEIVPCFDWDRIVLVPASHELASTTEDLSLEYLAKFPLVTYVFSFGQEASFLKAFAEKNLKPNVVFTARDADVIKTYVHMGMGVGVIASMAFEPEKETDLVAVPGTRLFPKSTTWIGYRKGRVLHPHMLDLINLVSEYEPPPVFVT